MVTYRVGLLDDRSIGDRVTERESELDDIRSSRLEGEHERDSSIFRGESSREERHKDAAS